jgi:large subunit ribosomal protein L23
MAAESNKTGSNKTKVSKKKSSKATGVTGKARISDYQILSGPVITEKSSLVGSQSASGPGGTIVLRVDKLANKDDVRAAVERIFNVNVVKVRTVNYSGKPKRTARSSGKRAGYKKAYVTLKEGQTVSLVEGL